MAQQTEKQMAAGQRRSLQAMRRKLLDMAEAWDGVDGYNQTCLVELADKVEEVAGGLLADDGPEG